MTCGPISAKLFKTIIERNLQMKINNFNDFMDEFELDNGFYKIKGSDLLIGESCDLDDYADLNITDIKKYQLFRKEFVEEMENVDSGIDGEYILFTIEVHDYDIEEILNEKTLPKKKEEQLINVLKIV